MMTVVVIKVIKISTCQYIALMRNKRCLSPPHRGLMFFQITSSFIYTSSINRIVTLSLSLSLSLDSIISLLCQPKQHWRRPLLPSGTATFLLIRLLLQTGIGLSLCQFVSCHIICLIQRLLSCYLLWFCNLALYNK